MREYCTLVLTLDAIRHHLVCNLAFLLQATTLAAVLHNPTTAHLHGYYKLGVESLRQMAWENGHQGSGERMSARTC